MFMVKKLVDEEKGEMRSIFEKECMGLFINVSRFGIDRCSLQFNFLVFLLIIEVMKCTINEMGLLL